MTLALMPNPSSDAEFLRVFNRLLVALREPADETGVTQGVYFDALKDLPLLALEAAAMALMKEPGRRFFPTTAEWRTVAERAQVDLLKQAVQPSREEPWRVECERCEDTGWVQGLTCDGTDRCGRQKAHAPHTFTKPCLCRPTNRTYQRHHHFGAGV